MCAHRAQKTAVGNAAAVQDIAAGVDDEVDVVEIKPRSLEDLGNDGRYQIDVLRPAPGNTEICLCRRDRSNPGSPHVISLFFTASQSRFVYAISSIGLSRKSRCFIGFFGLTPDRKSADRSPARLTVLTRNDIPAADIPWIGPPFKAYFCGNCLIPNSGAGAFASGLPPLHPLDARFVSRDSPPHFTRIH